MDINKIKQILPHRYPFLLVDKVLSVTANSQIHAIKNVTINEQFFNGHFPEKPVMPGVLIVEALAQTAGILINESMPEDSNAEGKLFYFAGIDNARFKKIVEPGDTLHLKVELIKARGSFWKFNAKAYVDEKLACSADISCAQA